MASRKTVTPAVEPDAAAAAPEVTDTPVETPPVDSADTAPVESDHERAARKRAAAFEGKPEARLQADIDALLAERRGYVVRGMHDRVAQVDEQIALRGGTPPQD